MPLDTPDFVTRIQVAVTVENVPIVPEPDTERAAGAVGSVITNEQDYTELAKWTVATGKVGELKHITIISEDYVRTYANITIGGVAWATAWSPTSCMPLVFEDLKLSAAQEVIVEIKVVADGDIEVNATIVGKEIG